MSKSEKLQPEQMAEQLIMKLTIDGTNVYDPDERKLVGETPELARGIGKCNLKLIVDIVERIAVLELDNNGQDEKFDDKGTGWIKYCIIDEIVHGINASQTRITLINYFSECFVQEKFEGLEGGFVLQMLLPQIIKNISLEDPHRHPATALAAIEALRVKTDANNYWLGDTPMMFLSAITYESTEVQLALADALAESAQVLSGLEDDFDVVGLCGTDRAVDLLCDVAKKFMARRTDRVHPNREGVRNVVSRVAELLEWFISLEKLDHKANRKAEQKAIKTRDQLVQALEELN